MSLKINKEGCMQSEKIKAMEIAIDKRNVTTKSEAHIVAIPIPAQGHINPMLQLCKRLKAKGLKVTFLAAASIKDALGHMHHPSSTTTRQDDSSSIISMHFISDGFDDMAKMQAQMAKDMVEFGEIFNAATRRSLTEFIQTAKEWENPPKLILYDSYMPWVLHVAREWGLCGAAFISFSCAVACILSHASEGDIKMPVKEEQVSLPALPPLQPADMPSFIHDADSYPVMGRKILASLPYLKKADWVLINTFHDLEKQVLKWMEGLWRIKVVGPTVPSIYLDKRFEDDIDYSLHLSDPYMTETTAWLDSKQNGSVVYVSFGSLNILSEKQMNEVAYALGNCVWSFIWVVDQKKLPAEFVEKVSNKGLIVSWCSQLEVLNHPAVGCFVTHCGWNSVLEALSAGVPMVAMPQWTDQPTHAKCVEDVWKVGVRAKTDQNKTGNKLIPKDEIERSISQVMNEGEKRSELRDTAAKWRGLSRAAMEEGGTSDKDINEFVSHLLSI